MNRVVSVIGLGYVGLPLAVAYAEKHTAEVIAFDISDSRIKELKKGIDVTKEVESNKLSLPNLVFTNEPSNLCRADFHIIAVPTPIDKSLQPDLSFLESASKTIASILKKGDIVVYESTVYPGVTEEECVPVLEYFSGLKFGEDFFVGYSPERINPGDKNHGLSDIVKVVSAQNKETLDIVSEVYGSIISAGIYQASSIRIAEAAKVIENTQRDINIAFINELKIIFDKMDIDIHDVLSAAATKWNFLNFQPGLVGGHCIGVDPYYLTYKAQELGYHPNMILSGRRVNDSMSKYFTEKVIKEMIGRGINVSEAKVGILGITFKENCPDIRNSKVIDMVKEFKSYNINTVIVDPVADRDEVYQRHQIEIRRADDIKNSNAIIVAVPHKEFKSDEFRDIVRSAQVCLDIKGLYEFEKNNCESKDKK